MLGSVDSVRRKLNRNIKKQGKISACNRDKECKRNRLQKKSRRLAQRLVKHMKK